MHNFLLTRFIKTAVKIKIMTHISGCFYLLQQHKMKLINQNHSPLCPFQRPPVAYIHLRYAKTISTRFLLVTNPLMYIHLFQPSNPTALMLPLHASIKVTTFLSTFYPASTMTWITDHAVVGAVSILVYGHK